MTAKRYEPNKLIPGMSEVDCGDFVHFSDYDKLIKTLRQIVRNGSLYDKEIAEAALLSEGEEL